MPTPTLMHRPVISRRLLLGIALSLLVHALLLLGPRLDLAPPADLQRLDVKLVRSAPELKPLDVAAAPPPPAKKKPAPKVEPAKPQTRIVEEKAEQAAPPQEPPKEEAALPPPEPIAAPEAPAEEDVGDAAQAAVAVPDAPAGGNAWPRAGRVAYAALMGEKRFPMGHATHQWEVGDDGRYRISALMEPTPVASIPWYQPGRKLTESAGRITPTGLRPERFVEREEGRPGETLAQLDWSAGELRTGSGTTPLPENAQDALSFLYQLGYPGEAAKGAMPVTGGSGLRDYRLEIIGEEALHLPFGESWRTQHIRARYGSGREMIDVWIALEHFGLPVLIRNIDSKGVIYYLVATEIMVSRESARPLPAAPTHPPLPAQTDSPPQAEGR